MQEKRFRIAAPVCDSLSFHRRSTERSYPGLRVRGEVEVIEVIACAR